VVRGSDVSLEAVPERGYHFVEWAGEQTLENVNDAMLELNLVIRNMRITARFAPDAIEFTSEDEMLSVIVPEGTLNGDGEPLSSVVFDVADVPPLPEQALIMGLPYDLGPSGATFDPPITIAWSYDPTEIPSGAAEDDLVIAHYDEDAGEWVELESDVDVEEDTITAEVDHFTVFAILAYALPPEPVTAPFINGSLSISPPEVNVGKPVSINVLLDAEEFGGHTVTLTIDGVVEETREVSSSGTVTFTVSRDEAGTYSVEVNGLPGSFTVKEGVSSPAPPPVAQEPSFTPPAAGGWVVNWAVVAPIIVAVFLAIFIPIRLRNRRGPLDW